jgi:hypothetical protein
MSVFMSVLLLVSLESRSLFRPVLANSPMIGVILIDSLRIKARDSIHMSLSAHLRHTFECTTIDIVVYRRRATKFASDTLFDV